jgi:putative tryptophan/tyrosine transport system substrate-binding protein
MKRRELLLLLMAGMMGARAIRAQQKAMPVIGWLSSVSPGQVGAYLAAFGQRLSETGYVEGQNVSIEYRWAENHYDRLPSLAAELVGLKVDVIETNSTIGATAWPDRATIDPRPGHRGHRVRAG